jgi:ribosomal protein L1
VKYQKLQYRDFIIEVCDLREKFNCKNQSILQDIFVAEYMNNRDIKELKDMLIDKKLQPDPRFDTVAEEIDSLKNEVLELKQEVKRFKTEKISSESDLFSMKKLNNENYIEREENS